MKKIEITCIVNVFPEEEGLSLKQLLHKKLQEEDNNVSIIKCQTV